MSRLVEALKKAGQTYKLFQKGEIGPCDSTPSAVSIPNLVPSTFCRIPAAAPVPVEEAPVGVEGAVPEMEGAIVKESEEIDPSAPDLQIDPQDQRIDVRAKFALQRMLKVPVTEDKDMAKNAARLIRGINSGTLEGIYGDDLKKAVDVAQEHNTDRWKLIPKGEDAALVLDKEKPLKGPIPPDKPPTVIFRGDTPDISKEPERFDVALKEAGHTFELWQEQELGACDNTGWIVPVTNLVPSSYCMAMGIPSGKSACSTLKRPEILDNFDQGKSDLKLSHKRKICIIARCVKDRHGTPAQIDSISLIGHASSEGDPSFNETLGQRRANEVRKDLIIALDREMPGLSGEVQIDTETRGPRESRNLGPAKDRRVEVFLPHKAISTASELLVIVTTKEGGHEAAPVKGATVEVTGPLISKKLTDKTNELGQVGFQDLEPGKYHVTASKEGFKDATKQVLLPDDMIQTAAFADNGEPITSPGGSKPVLLQLAPIITQLILIEHPEQNLPQAPELTDEARWGVLRKGGVPGGATTPLPDIPAWHDVWIRIDRPQKGPLLYPVDPDTGGNPRNGETTIYSATGKKVNVISEGVYAASQVVNKKGPSQVMNKKALIHWHVTSDKPVGTVDGVQEARLTGRVRFSLWANPDYITEKNLSKKLPLLKADDIIDDLSLLVTVQNDTQSKIMPTWDVWNNPKLAIFKNDEEKLINYYKEIIKLCHSHQIQVLAGFGLVDHGKSRIVQFDNWLDDLTTHADGGQNEASRFAKALVKFIDDRMPGFDGISFDIESCGLFQGSLLKPAHKNPSTHKDKINKLRRALRFFYHAVADCLVAENRICAITVGGMMHDDWAAYGKNIEKSLKAPPGTGLKSVPNAKVFPLLWARLHTYDLPIGKPNIIIRPMGYDNAGGEGNNATAPYFNKDGFSGNGGQFEWHKAIIEFALKTKRLNPQQIQLGIKNFTPIDKETKEKKGQGGTVPEKSRILKRCKEILRPNRVGLIFFCLRKPPGEPWDKNNEYNSALNADPLGNPILPFRKGQPLQVPLNDKNLSNITK